jgi:hypothetical protein
VESIQVAISNRFGPQDWAVARNEVIENFTPGTPINEADLFAGRQDTVRQLQDTVLEPGRHAIIFGERGVGKTSIANVFHRSLNTETRHLHAIRINSDASDSFDSLWQGVPAAQERGDGAAVWADEAHPQPITPNDVQIEMADFYPHQTPIVIIDEFDRIVDDRCRLSFSDAIKTLQITPSTAPW